MGMQPDLHGFCTLQQNMPAYPQANTNYPGQYNAPRGNYGHYNNPVGAGSQMGGQGYGAPGSSGYGLGKYVYENACIVSDAWQAIMIRACIAVS